MKNLKILFTIILAALLFTACKKDSTDKTKKYSEENPLADYLAATGFDQSTTPQVNLGVYRELGFTFTPKVKGEIHAVTVKIPDNADNIRVTIWKVSDKSVLKTINITDLTAGDEKKESINPIILEKDVQYLISFNTNDVYVHFRTDQGNVTYPIVAGNLTIDGCWARIGTAQAYPEDYFFDAYEGDVSFIFQQTE